MSSLSRDEKLTADKNRFTTTCIAKDTLQKLKSLTAKMGYASTQELIREMALAVDKANFGKFEILCLQTYGRIPEIIEGSARNEGEMYAKLGLDGPKTKKIGQIENVEKIGELSTVMLKDEEKKEEK
jgi:hypothetical protein